MQLHHPDYPAKKRSYDTLKADVVAPIKALDGVDAVAPRLFSYALGGGAETSAGVQLVGVSPVDEAGLTGIEEKLSAGEWLAAEPSLQAVLGVDLAEELSVGVGDEIVLVGQDAYGGVANDLYTVVGVARTGQTARDRAGVWVHLSDLQMFLAMEDQVHEILVVGDDVEGAAERLGLAERERHPVAAVGAPQKGLLVEEALHLLRRRAVGRQLRRRRALLVILGQ